MKSGAAEMLRTPGTARRNPSAKRGNSLGNCPDSEPTSTKVVRPRTKASRSFSALVKELANEAAVSAAAVRCSATRKRA